MKTYCKYQKCWYCLGTCRCSDCEQGCKYNRGRWGTYLNHPTKPGRARAS